MKITLTPLRDFQLGVSVIFNPIDLLRMAWYRIAWQSTPISW
jgi:hypothetical protein